MAARTGTTGAPGDRAEVQTGGDWPMPTVTFDDGAGVDDHRRSGHSGAVDVSAEVLAGLRRVCRELPEAYEEEAWVGVRWRVRGQTFAHVLVIDAGWPPAYARAAHTDGPATVMMFRSSGPDLAALREGGPPFFAPPWRADEVGLVLAAYVDWAEVAELVTDSYCLQAPKRLAATVVRPTT
jgi:hypothetical protein